MQFDLNDYKYTCKELSTFKSDLSCTCARIKVQKQYANVGTEHVLVKVKNICINSLSFALMITKLHYETIRQHCKLKELKSIY